MADPILKKPSRKKAKSKSHYSSGPSIPISRDDLLRLHDITDSLKLLRDIVDEAPEMKLIQVEILIQKASRCAWNLIYEELDDRWQELHPKVDLIRRG